MEYKANTFFRILFYLFSGLIILVIDGLYQIFRVIINENIVRIKMFGKIIKEEKIETVEYNNKRYGIKKFTHMFGRLYITGMLGEMCHNVVDKIIEL
jgi:hypothetical protein